MKLTIGKCLLVGMLAATVASADLLTNPGFETGDLTDWTGAAWYAGGGGDAHSGSWGGAYYVPADVADGGYFILEQFVEVVGGQLYDASCWGRLAGTANNSEQFLEVQWLDGNGDTMWGDGFGTTPVSGPQDYTQYALNDIAAPALAATASVRAVVHTTALTTDNAWHTFDDFSFAESVPEPTTMAFLGLGLLGAFFFRKGKNLR